MIAAAGPRSRTNAERTATTRAKLLEATAACLSELGYARTSTTEIARRAGVSRGAQLHHFPTKGELVAAAVRYVMDRRVEEFRAILTTLPEGPGRLDAAIDVLWSIMEGPSFDAWFELVAASRTDTELQPVLADLSDGLRATVRTLWVELFPPPAAEELHAVYDAVPGFFFSVLDGLVLQRMAGGTNAEADRERTLGLVKLLGSLLNAAALRPDLAEALLQVLNDPTIFDAPPGVAAPGVPSAKEQGR